MSVAIALLDLTLETVEANLALDEALLIEADEGRAGAVLRFWDFPRFAVVLGASRRLAGDVRVDACQQDGVPIVRRSSGGGTVVIGPGALNVTVILPNSAAPGSRQSISRIGMYSTGSPGHCGPSIARSLSKARAT